MSNVDQSRHRTTPPLADGQRLDAPTFLERYEAMPPETHAELIGGTVAMMSPAGAEHGEVLGLLAGWLYSYTQGLPGLKFAVASTTLLGDSSVPEPDLNLRVRPEFQGRTRTEGRFVTGPPELAVEVSVTTRAKDLGPKRTDYERAGVLEYLVVTLDPDEVHWFGRREETFVPLEPGPEGLFRSGVFPGLWLDPAALFTDDRDGLVAAVGRGKATDAFAAFAADLAARKVP